MNKNVVKQQTDITPPPLECKGCIARDHIIHTLAMRVDELTANKWHQRTANLLHFLRKKGEPATK